MTNIDRTVFLNQLRHGVDLKSAGLNDKLNLTEDQTASFKNLDRNRDHLLTGDELRDAFRFVDALDANGSARSFDVEGEAYGVYEALLAGARPGPYYGGSIAKAAADRAQGDSAGYAYENAPTSPFAQLSGNTTAGTTRPGWLANQNKCNQFVGDALTAAGVRMPTFPMSNGTEHYMNAEKLPFQFDYFDRIVSTEDIKTGDVIVVDYPGAGESTAHTEIVTGVDPLRTTGAHNDGAHEKDWSDLFDNTAPNAAERCWDSPDGDKIYVLRPTRKIQGE